MCSEVSVTVRFSGYFVESVLKEKRKAIRWEGFEENEGFKPAVKE